MSETWWISDADLDPDQARAIQEQPEDASFLIRGPAGSGKTNILLLRAKWFQLKGKSHFKVVVFTRSLRDFIRDGCEEYGIPRDNVVTSTQFLREFLSEHSVPFESSGNFEEERLLLSGKTQSFIEANGISDSFDALLVDECQDYLDTELLIFRKLAKRLVIAADSRQSIYKSTQSPGLLEKLVFNNLVTLKYHYRSGLKICRVADGILRESAIFSPIQDSSLYKEGVKPSSIELVECANLRSQFEAIIKQIPNQLYAYPGELVGILFPKRDQVAEFQVELDKCALGDEASRVKVDTMHGAKGLEFRAVHLGGCEALYRMGSTQKRLVYTAILRGRTAVAVYFTGSVPGYLSSAIAQLAPPKPSPKLNELFK